MTSTLPFYEKKYIHLSHPMSGPTLNNIYHGHFSQVGTREGRLISRAPIARPVMDRYKTYQQLEYTLPPSVKDRR